MILKPFPSLLLHRSSQMLQKRIALAFQVVQTLISPKIVFLAAHNDLVSQLSMGIPMAPGAG